MSIEELLKKLYDVKINDEKLLSELIKLVKSGVTAKDIDTARNREFRDGNETLLCLACERNCVETIKFLISIHCDVNLKGSYDFTPLMNNTSTNGSLEITELLLLNGANNSINLQNNSTGRTALMHACIRGNIEKVKLLLKYGADASIKDNRGMSAYDFSNSEISNLLKNAENYRRVEENIDIEMKSEEEVNITISRLAKKLRGV